MRWLWLTKGEVGVGSEMERSIHFEGDGRHAPLHGHVNGEQLVVGEVLVLVRDLHGVEAGGDVVVQLGDDDVGGLLFPRLHHKDSALKDLKGC